MKNSLFFGQGLEGKQFVFHTHTHTVMDSS